MLSCVERRLQTFQSVALSTSPHGLVLKLDSTGSNEPSKFFLRLEHVVDVSCMPLSLNTALMETQERFERSFRKDHSLVVEIDVYDEVLRLYMQNSANNPLYDATLY